jgi:hypothetical protein
LAATFDATVRSISWAPGGRSGSGAAGWELKG